MPSAPFIGPAMDQQYLPSIQRFLPDGLDEGDPGTPVAALTERFRGSRVVVEVGAADEVRDAVGVGIPDERRALPPREQGRAPVGPCDRGRPRAGVRGCRGRQ